MRVLILGARAPAALEMARQFASAGHEVGVGDSGPCALTGWSSAVSFTLPRLPAPRSDLRGFAAALAGHVRDLAIKLIIPTCEEVFYLSRIRGHLPGECAVFAPVFGQLERLHSKFHVLEVAEASGIRTPRAERVFSMEEARAWAGTRPVVLKPEYSRFGSQVRCFPEGITDAAAPLPSGQSWVVQQLCQGTEVCSYGVAHQGRLVLNVCYRPIYRLSLSSGYYFEALPAPEIDERVGQIVADLGYHGQIAFDWFVDASGRATLIECNPRSVSGVHLIPNDGRLCAAIVEGVPAAAPTSPPRMIGAVMLAVGLPHAMKQGLMGEWWRDWQRARDVCGRPGDWSPLFGGMSDAVAYVWQALQRGTSVRAASTSDIEWDGEALSE